MSATSQVPGTADPRPDESPSTREGSSAASGHARIVTFLMLLIPAALALAISGYHLGRAPLWRDEAATVSISQRSVGQILATLPHDDAVHGLYYLVIHVVMTVAGSSVSELRMPTLIGMAVASAFTALVTRDLARMAGAPFATLTGMTAGAIFAITPSTVGYAQQARSYAIVTAMATIATYLLLRALRGDRRWWAAYGVAIALTGLFNLFGALIVAAHAVTILLTHRRDPRRWVVTAGVACVVLVPVAYLAYTERGALSWINKPPGWPGFVAFIHNATDTSELTWPLIGLAVLGVVVEVAARRSISLGPAAVAVPWFLVPPVVLLLASEVAPMWDVRYVEYCIPAFAILVAWGLNGLGRLVIMTSRRGSRVAWMPVAVVPLLLLAAFWPGEHTNRTSRPDSMIAESQIIARNARPGDAVMFFPINFRDVTAPYPDPWRKLRDVALAQTPVASNTLYGIDVPAAQLPQRMAGVSRVWVVTSSLVNYFNTGDATPFDFAERAFLSRMHVIGRWRDGDTALILYARS
jgi:mannosyltransferase